MPKPASAFEVVRSLVAARCRWRPPVYLVHALTARCNARCGFCAWNPDFYDPSQQLPTEAIAQLYTDARRAGFIGLSIWGGEPLLHPDFGDLVRHARDVGLLTHMVTNGFLLERKIDAVVSYVDRLCISLDHPSAVHDEIRGVRGLFDRIVASTRELRRRAPDLPIIFVYTLLKQNVAPDTLRAAADLMAELGVLGIFNDLRVDAATDAPDTTLAGWAPSDDERAAAFVTLTELKRRGYPILDSFTYLGMMRQGPPVYRCHWPKFMLPVEANGDVVDCMHWGTRPIGNVARTPLTELLAHPRLRALGGHAGEACHACVSIHRVEISEVWNGNLEPLRSWRMLRTPPPPVATVARAAGAAGRAP
jgi:MoaA/NifB/PqqE/SkfB family radical SAM enzyme